MARLQGAALSKAAANVLRTTRNQIHARQSTFCQQSVHPQPRKVTTSSYSSLRTPIAPASRTSRRTLPHRTCHFARSFSTTSTRQHGDLTPPRPGEERRITFIDKEGQQHTFEVSDGDNLLDIAQANDLEMEGACGGSCACSTCHVIVEDEAMYDKMMEAQEATEEAQAAMDDEEDMLDLAFGRTETSRLGCQVKMSKELDGLVVRLPSMTRNLQPSDFAGK